MGGTQAKAKRGLGALTTLCQEEAFDQILRNDEVCGWFGWGWEWTFQSG